MNQFKICGFNVEFNYNYDDFFIDQIEAYRSVFNKPDLILNVKILDNISPIDDIGEEVKNQKIFTYDDKIISEVYNKSKTSIMCKINNSRDYRKIEISFVSRLGDKLPEYEYALTGASFMAFISTRGLLGLHASAIEYNNDAILFSAPSGTGKSTQANLWTKVLQGVSYINDDKPLLKWVNDRFYAYGSPWSGKHSINKNVNYPVKAIIFIKQSGINVIEEIGDNEKLVYLLRNMHRPQEQKTYELLLDIVNKVIKHIPIYVYHCNMEDEAVYKLHDKLYQGGINEDKS